MVVLLLSAAACNGSDGDTASTAHVGSRDCEVIRASTSDPLTAQVCGDCQGADCSIDACTNLPCVDGGSVVQGCAEDGDCAEFSDARLCGKHQAADNICVVQDDL